MLPATFYDGYGSASLSVWWFRWLPNFNTGYWIVGRNPGTFFELEPNSNAVIDDFGNLVRVP